MKMITTFAAGAAMAFAAIPFASPAMAQGDEAKFPVPRSGCPKKTTKSRRGSDTIFYCYPNKDSNDDTSSTSASSSSSGGTYTAPTYGNIIKANKFDRCPVGYHTDPDEGSKCVSYHQDKSPASRLKKGGTCAADEVDEWGLWCTSRSTTLTRAEAEDEAVSDVNNVFLDTQLEGNGSGARQGGEYENTPGILAIFGPAGGNQSAASSAPKASGDQAASQQAAQCITGNGAATGAAIGGAVGGDAGAVLGGMLGGLGKKKKKKGC